MRERNAELRDSGLITRVDQKIVRFSPIHESDSNDSVAMTKLSSNSCSSDIDCFNASQPTEVKVISDGYSQGIANEISHIV